MQVYGPCIRGPGIYGARGNDHVGIAPTYGNPDESVIDTPVDPKAMGLVTGKTVLVDASWR